MSEFTPLMMFRYRGLFQSADIRFFKKNLKQSYEIICDAEVKLPILKKAYTMKTEFLNDLSEWIRHTPAHEKGGEIPAVSREQVYAEQSNTEVLDPVGFFLLLDDGGWDRGSVNLLVGKRIITLDVEKKSTGLEIHRREKNQKLMVHRDKGGISKIEVPVPMIGSLSLERVRT